MTLEELKNHCDNHVPTSCYDFEKVHPCTDCCYEKLCEKFKYSENGTFEPNPLVRVHAFLRKEKLKRLLK